MRLVLADPTFLKDSISVISDLVNEARFKVTKNGLELVAMDPANVAMVIFKFLSSSFTEYEVEKEQEIGHSFLTPLLWLSRPVSICAQIPPALESVLLKAMRLNLGEDGRLDRAGGYSGFTDLTAALKELRDRQGIQEI